MEEMPKTQRTAIVTGAAQGIGSGIALRLAMDGLAVTLADLPSSRDLAEAVAAEITASGGTARVAVCDASVMADVERVVADHVAAFGGLDVMVANAGITLIAKFMDTTPEILNRTLDINLKGVFHCYQAAARQMIAQGRGGRLIRGLFDQRPQGWRLGFGLLRVEIRGPRIDAKRRAGTGAAWHYRECLQSRHGRHTDVGRNRPHGDRTRGKAARCTDPEGHAGHSHGPLCDTDRHRQYGVIPGIRGFCLCDRTIACGRWRHLHELSPSYVGRP